MTWFKTFTKKFFTDKNGNIAIWQWPNIPLTGWLITKLFLSFLPHNRLVSGVRQLSSALLFTWAYIEITQGTSYFRRVLGAGVMVLLLIGMIHI